MLFNKRNATAVIPLLAIVAGLAMWAPTGAHAGQQQNLGDQNCAVHNARDYCPFSFGRVRGYIVLYQSWSDRVTLGIHAKGRAGAPLQFLGASGTLELLKNPRSNHWVAAGVFAGHDRSHSKLVRWNFSDNWHAIYPGEYGLLMHVWLIADGSWHCVCVYAAVMVL